MNLNEFEKSTPALIEDAIKTGSSIPGVKKRLTPSTDSMEELDTVVEYLHQLWKKRLIDDTVAWNLSVTFGALLGEMIIRKHGFHWAMNKYEIPVVEKGKRNQMSPITKIYKIIVDEESNEGLPSLFYKGFFALLEHRDC